MVESTLTQEAYFLRSTIHQQHALIRESVDPETIQTALARRDSSLIRLLELRKTGPLPFQMGVQLHSDPLVEEIHPFSLTPTIINLPTEAQPDSPFTIQMNLTQFATTAGVSDARNALEILGEVEYSGVRQNRLLMRTVREIQAVEEAQAKIPTGNHDPRRKELRELRDKLIIERFIYAKVNKMVPVKSELAIVQKDGLIWVIFKDDRYGKFPLPIEAPIPGKYSDERNQQLQALLEQLDLAA